MKCPNEKSVLDKYLGGLLLKPEGKSELEHLRNCEKCQRMLKDEAALYAVLSSRKLAKKIDAKAKKKVFGMASIKISETSFLL